MCIGCGVVVTPKHLVATAGDVGLCGATAGYPAFPAGGVAAPYAVPITVALRGVVLGLSAVAVVVKVAVTARAGEPGGLARFCIGVGVVAICGVGAGVVAIRARMATTPAPTPQIATTPTPMQNLAKPPGSPALAVTATLTTTATALRPSTTPLRATVIGTA